MPEWMTSALGGLRELSNGFMDLGGQFGVSGRFLDIRSRDGLGTVAHGFFKHAWPLS